MLQLYHFYGTGVLLNRTLLVKLKNGEIIIFY